MPTYSPLYSLGHSHISRLRAYAFTTYARTALDRLSAFEGTEADVRIAEGLYRQEGEDDLADELEALYRPLSSEPLDLEHPPAPPTVVDESTLEGEGAPLTRAEVEDVAGHEHAAILDGRDPDGHKHVDEGTEFSSGNSRGLMVGHGGATPGRLDSRGGYKPPASPSSHAEPAPKEGGQRSSRARVDERRRAPDRKSIPVLYAESRRLYDELHRLTQRLQQLDDPANDWLFTKTVVRAEAHLEMALTSLWIASCVLEVETLCSSHAAPPEAGGTEA